MNEAQATPERARSQTAYRFANQSNPDMPFELLLTTFTFPVRTILSKGAPVYQRLSTATTRELGVTLTGNLRICEGYALRIKVLRHRTPLKMEYRSTKKFARVFEDLSGSKGVTTLGKKFCAAHCRDDISCSMRVYLLEQKSNIA